VLRNRARPTESFPDDFALPGHLFETRPSSPVLSYHGPSGSSSEGEWRTGGPLLAESSPEMAGARGSASAKGSPEASILRESADVESYPPTAGVQADKALNSATSQGSS
jgi:hypothetical protein